MGDVFYEGCSMFTCVKKGKKLKWIESPASDRCCSYEGVLYPPGQEVAKLTTSDNCSEVRRGETDTTSGNVHLSGQSHLLHWPHNPGDTYKYLKEMKEYDI